MLEERGALPKEDGDLIREYKATHGSFRKIDSFSCPATTPFSFCCCERASRSGRVKFHIQSTTRRLMCLPRFRPVHECLATRHSGSPDTGYSSCIGMSNTSLRIRFRCSSCCALVGGRFVTVLCLLVAVVHPSARPALVLTSQALPRTHTPSSLQRSKESSYLHIHTQKIHFLHS